MNLSTVINWQDARIHLPPVDPKESSADWVESIVVLGTDGDSLDDVCYVYYCSDAHEDKWLFPRPDWFLVNFGTDYKPNAVDYWCDYANIILPKKPVLQKYKSPVVSNDQKYTLQQLRQAWAAGKYAD